MRALPFRAPGPTRLEKADHSGESGAGVVVGLDSVEFTIRTGIRLPPFVGLQKAASNAGAKAAEALGNVLCVFRFLTESPRHRPGVSNRPR
jgi:hypothetical protein